MNPTKWTHDARVDMYSRILTAFGPYNTWGGNGHPAGKKEEWDAFMITLAQTLSLIYGKEFSIGCIEQQLSFATQFNKKIHVKTAGMVISYILNVGVALEVGFLECNDIPDGMMAM